VVAVAQPRRALFLRILDELGKTWFVVVPGSVLETLLSQPVPALAVDVPAAELDPTAATDTLHDELRAAREDPAALGGVEAALRSVRAELARLGEVEAELRATREELGRLEETLRTEVARRGRGTPSLLGLIEHGAP
jgi:hypothetical protein